MQARLHCINAELANSVDLLFGLHDFIKSSDFRENFDSVSQVIANLRNLS